MITLPSLKADKYHPGTKGARPPLNCSRVHRPGGRSDEPGARCGDPGGPCPPPAAPAARPCSRGPRSPEVQAPLTQKSLFLDATPPTPFQTTPQTLLLECLNLTFLHLYLCNALINVCLPPSAAEPSRGVRNHFRFPVVVLLLPAPHPSAHSTPTQH